VSTSIEPMDPERLDLPSASNAAFWSCAGQSNLVKKMPTEATHSDSKDEITERGTRIHKARETGNTFPLDEEEMKIYLSGLEYEAKILAKWRDINLLGPDDYVEGPREERLWLHDPQTLNPVASGKLDVHYVSKNYKHALVIDWKTGFCSHLVGATGSSQLRLQAVLLKNEIPSLETIWVAFCKPLFDHKDIDYCTYEEMDLKYSLEAVMLHLYWSRQADAQRVPGKHCRYCPARAGWCPQAAAYALLPSVIASQVLIGDKPADAVEKCTPQDLYELWDNGPTIRSILDESVKRLRAFSESQLKELCLMFGKGRERNTITNVRECHEYLLKLGWPEEEVWKCMDFINGRIAELVMRQKGLEKKDAGEWVKTELARFITKSEDAKPIRSLK
jgi:hypothetical protein